MAGIPLSDDYLVRRVPVVTYSLVAVNVLVYLLSPMSMLATWYGADPGARLCAVDLYLLRWAAVPAELLTGQPLGAEAGAFTDCSGEVAKWPWLSSVTSMFLHGDSLHLAGNMVYLFVFGPCVEDRLGRFRFLAIYLLTGVVASYGFALSEGPVEVPLVGASGAISGVLGAYLIVQFRSRVITLLLGFLPVRLPGWMLVATYFALDYFLYLSLSLSPDGQNPVAYAAHVYGFVAGLLAGLLVYRVRWRAGARLSDVH
ncbi:rhomboid family intramembrane serine protease [Actinorugispora endophytica]|uniref:Membrane associated rhomboid family serine protease n=1 Tax=Actinorugispora endophytica TaxID=1605990 RepID=A0A4R6UYD4_9ACTN|nr:rhomboid family intramembrane serine protease [Actinorugispora endophytica]TDQ52504.1 membrane associated rhomboid family serine protease [Actinorugispora endophytica]